MSVKWPARLSLAVLPTPLQPLTRLFAHDRGPRIWVKRDDLSGSTLTGNKVRKLEFTIAHALAGGHDLLITCGGLQSNHCRATAYACAQLGIPVHLVLRGDQPDVTDGNLLLDQLAGAHISYHPVADYQKNLQSILEHTVHHYRRLGFSPYVIPTGASDGVGLWGYFAACQELQRDFSTQRVRPQLIVTATGSGGTQAGLTLGAEYFDLGCQVLGMAVCDDEAYFSRKVEADITDFKNTFHSSFTEQLPESFSINTNDQYIGQGYGIASDEVLETISRVARTEGLLLDPVYSGKAFHGLMMEIAAGNMDDFKDIIFIHTGGNFGVFPYRNQFQSLSSVTQS